MSFWIPKCYYCLRYAHHDSSKNEWVMNVNDDPVPDAITTFHGEPACGECAHCYGVGRE